MLFCVSAVNANVLGLWEMDESSGLNASVGSLNDNHGTLLGGLNFDAHSVAGKYGNALQFNGTSYYAV